MRREPANHREVVELHVDDQPQAPETHTFRGLHLCAGHGTDSPAFWLGSKETGEGFRESHIASDSPSREAVQSFFDAAVASGAQHLHEPRVWPE